MPSRATAQRKGPLRVFEAFSGIGAQRAALRDLGIPFEIVGTCDWFTDAIVAYDAIHTADEPDVPLPSYEDQVKELSALSLSADSQKPLRSLKKLSSDSITRLYKARKRSRNFGSVGDLRAETMPKADLLVYSFPCQDLSTGGNGHGMKKGSGSRSSQVWALSGVLKGLKEQNRLPEFLLMENVPSITAERYRMSFGSWKARLTNLGYVNDAPLVLDATEFGIPQERSRLFFASHLRTPLDLASKIRKQPWTSSSDMSQFLRLDYSNPVLKAEADEAKLIMTPSRQEMWDINGRENPLDASNPIHTITCNMDRTQTAALFRYDGAMRRLTIREAFLLMGFREEDYEKAKMLGFSYRKMNKLIGNSIVVPVLREVFRAMLNGAGWNIGRSPL